MISMKRAGILLFVLVQSISVHAQQNKFQVGMGYRRTWMIDGQVSPLKYQAGEKTFLFNYEHRSSSGKIIASLEGAKGKMFPAGLYNRQLYNPGYQADGTPKKDSSFMTGRLYHGRINIGYLSSIANGISRVGRNDIHTGDYLGGSVSNQIFYSDNMVRAGWFNSTSANVDYHRDVLWNTKHAVYLKVSIPLFARNSRLPYHNTISSEKGDGPVKTFFKEGSRFAWLADFQNVQVNATYEYAVSRHMGIGLNYSGQWLRYRHERPVTLFQNNIGIIATVK